MATVFSNSELVTVIASFVNLIKANALGVTVVAQKTCEFNKGTKNNRSKAYRLFYNEEVGDWVVRKVTTYTNVTFQRNYTNSVENRGDNPMPYEAELPKGKRWFNDETSFILKSVTDETKLYLRFAENANTKRSSTYYVGNRIATEAEREFIKKYEKVSKGVCHKQIEYGVDADHLVKCKDITLTNIVGIKFGDLLLKLK